jgi:hypothetical protein
MRSPSRPERPSPVVSPSPGSAGAGAHPGRRAPDPALVLAAEARRLLEVAHQHPEPAGAEHGHALSTANVMIERFIAIRETEPEAERNLTRLATAFGRFDLGVVGEVVQLVEQVGQLPGRTHPEQGSVVGLHGRSGPSQQGDGSSEPQPARAHIVLR